MVEILVRGGDAEAAASELEHAIREIFAVEPTRIADSRQAPATRGLVEAALIVLALPSAIAHSREILADKELRRQLRDLITKAFSIRETTRAKVLIDPGDGKLIPLEEGKHDAIILSLQEIARNMKSTNLL